MPSICFTDSPTAVPLSSLGLYQQAVIVAVVSDNLRLALLKMGVSVGNRLSIANIAPLGDPIALSVNGTKISLRKADAAQIWIEPQI